MSEHAPRRKPPRARRDGPLTGSAAVHGHERALDVASAIGNRNVLRLLDNGVQRDVLEETTLASIRMADSPRLLAAARNAPPLKRGDPDRDAVKRVQETLIDDGFELPRSTVQLQLGDIPLTEYSGQTVDGRFGSETLATVKAFQRGHELEDDGIVGRFTMEALDAVAARRTPSDQPLGGPLGADQPTRSFSRDEYIEMWERKHGRRMTGQERHTLARGCIGITALNLQDGANPPLGLSFATFPKARSVAAALNEVVESASSLDGLTPEVIAAAPELANLQNVLESLPTTGSPDQWKAMIFSKRFYSNQAENWHDRMESDPDAFQPDEDTGQVDMGGYQYHARPRPEEGEGSTFVNFDYGWWDEETDTWWHANHAESGMEVYQSTLEHYSRPLRDFDRQVFTVAFARRI